MSGEAPEQVCWMHNSLGYWFSVADECKEDGDVLFVRADLTAPVAVEGEGWMGEAEAFARWWDSLGETIPHNALTLSEMAFKAGAKLCRYRSQ